MMLGWGPILEQTTGMKVRMIAEGNYSNARKALLAGDVDTDVVNLLEALSQYTAQAQWASKTGGAEPTTRVLWLGQQLPFGYGVWKDSPIKTIYDLKGAKVGLPTGLSGPKLGLEGTLAWANLKWEDVQIVPFADHTAHTRGMMEGKCDVAQVMPTSPVGFEAEASPHGLRFLEMNPSKDPEGAKRFWSVNAVQTFGVATVGCKSGLGLGMFSSPFFITTTESMDSQLAYNLAKWFDTNIDKYKDIYVLNPTMSSDSFKEVLPYSFLPVHEGTIKYLRGIGKWDAKNDAIQKSNIALADAWAKAYKDAMAQAEQKGIAVDPSNKAWLEFWTNYQKQASLPPIKLATS